jgi:uncharacterized membrane protein YfcA
MITDPWFYAVAVPAVLLMGLAKGGLAGVGTVATPMLALAVPPVQAASIALPILIVQDAVSVWAFRRSFDKSILVLMLPAAIVGIGIGWALAEYTRGGGVEFALGVISILFGLHRLWAERHRALPSRPLPKWLGFLCGVLAGFTSQVAHAGAPPFQMYVMPKRLERDVLVGTTAIFFASVNWLKVPAYIALGQFTRETMTTSAVLLPLAVATTYAGVWVVRKLNGDWFYRIVYILLVLVGAKLMWDGAVALWG